MKNKERERERVREKEREYEKKRERESKRRSEKELEKEQNRRKGLRELERHTGYRRKKTKRGKESYVRMRKTSFRSMMELLHSATARKERMKAIRRTRREEEARRKGKQGGESLEQLRVKKEERNRERKRLTNCSK